MFRMISGASVADASLIKQEYCIDGQWISANVSAENIPEVFREFFEYEGDRLYCLWIEIPSSIDNEIIEKVATKVATDIEPGIMKSTHRDVYYLDNLDRNTARELLGIFKEILINDGLTCFGFISQRGNEIGKYKYNVMNAYSDAGDADGLKTVFDRLRIPERESIKTAWDYIDPKRPGVSEKHEMKDGRNVYDIIEVLKENGMYLAEQRED